MVQIEKSQCLLNREFPEFFKTHPTFIFRSKFKASRTLKLKRRVLLPTIVSYSHKSQVLSIKWKPIKRLSILSCFTQIFAHSTYCSEVKTKRSFQVYMSLTLMPVKLVVHSKPISEKEKMGLLTLVDSDFISIHQTQL